MNDRQRLSEAVVNIERAEASSSPLEQRRRVLVAVRHLIAWLGNDTDAREEELDASEEASRHG